MQGIALVTPTQDPKTKKLLWSAHIVPLSLMDLHANTFESSG